jgi:hypothetical protein
MALRTLTLGTGATRFTTAPLRAMQLKIWQGAAASYVGDSPTVSSTTGIPVRVASPTADPTTIGPFTSGAINLDEWFGIGTSGDVIYYQYTPEE